MTDADRCAEVLINRCVLLVTYHHGPARPPSAEAGMGFELRWLAADARRWGVPAGVIVSGVGAELGRRYDRGTARGMFAEFVEAFRHATGLSPIPADARDADERGAAVPPGGRPSASGPRPTTTRV